MRGLGAKSDAHWRALHLCEMVGSGNTMRFLKVFARSAALVIWFFIGIMAVHFIAAAGFALGGPLLALAIYLFFIAVFLGGLMVAADVD